MNNNEVKSEKYYLNLLEKQKEFTKKDKQCINRLLKENEELKDLVKRQVCQAECYRYKQYEQLTQKLEKAKGALEYYAEEENYNDSVEGDGEIWIGADIATDRGKTAQQVLKELK